MKLEHDQAENYVDDSQPEYRPRSVFWMFFWILIACLVAKVYYLNGLYPFFQHKSKQVWLETLAGITQSDAGFVIIAGMISALLLLITAPLSRLHRLLHAVIRLFAMVCIAYVIIAAAAFDFVRSYPTCTMAYQIGGWRAPLLTLMSRNLWIVLAATIAAWFILYPLFTHYFRPKRPVLTWLSAIFLLGALFCWWRYAEIQTNFYYKNRQDIRIADSSHWTMLRSIARNLADGQWVHEDPVFHPDDLRDFQTAENRATLPEIARGPGNVIVVCLESVATRYLTIYGSEYPTTPSLQAEVQHALIFDNIYSHVTNSGNSLYPMLLSKYPPLSWREAAITHPDAPGPTIANMLSERGYRTAFISAGTTQYANGEKFLANRGFDLIQDFRDSGCPYYTDWGVEDRCMIDMILKFIGQSPPQAKPFFVLAWSNQTHWPYEPSPGQTEIDFLKGDASYGNMTWDFGRYLNAIHEADAQIGRLLAELRKRNLADDTLVIITGDHGEGMGRPHPYYGHSGKIYQEDVNVPLIIWNPAIFKNASHNKTIGAHIDLGPTILHYLNASLPPAWQGHSLMDPSHPNRAYFYGSADEYLLGVRDGNFKYILNTTKERDELYDLGSDPSEQNNIAHQQRDKTNELRRRTAAWLHMQLTGP